MNLYSAAAPETACTLCDFCVNACGGCRWSRKGIQRPVPGWDAIRRDICLVEGRTSPVTESYVVIQCPDFLVEKHRVDEFLGVDWEGVRRGALEEVG